MPNGPLLEIEGISLRVEAGELAVVTSPSQSWGGIDNQKVILNGDDVTSWGAEVQLHAGLFVTAGHPSPVPGIRTIDLLHRIGGSDQGASARRALVAEWCDRLDLDPEVIERNLDAEFSPSEGVGLELIQLALLSPDIAIIDLLETLTDEASRNALVSGLRHIRTDQPDIAVVVVTNDNDLQAGLTPDRLPTHSLTDLTLAQAHRDEALL